MPDPFSFYGRDPLSSIGRLQSEMNRLFQSAAGGTSGFPAMNAYASQDGIAITAEVPGVDPDSLDISVHRDTITLRGERAASDGDVRGWHRRERPFGRFTRTLSLPFQVDTDSVEANLSNGILEVSLQRPESDRPRKIQVKAS
jgi:HSP20 family protein